MIGSWQQESVYVGIAVLEAAALYTIKPAASPVIWAVRFYLRTQLFLFAILFPLSLSSDCQLYLPAYTLSLIPDFLAEMVIVAGIFWEMKGDSRRFGDGRVWAAYVMIGATCACALLLIQPPAKLNVLSRWLLACDQALVLIRVSALFAVFVRGVLCGTSWPRRVSLTWLGLGLYTVLEFGSQRLELLESFRRHAVLKYIPTAGAVLMLALWWSALRAPRHTAATKVPFRENLPA